MNRVFWWVALVVASLLAGCGYRAGQGGTGGTGGTGGGTHSPRQAVVGLAPSSTPPGFVPSATPEPFPVTRGSAALGQPISATWVLPNNPVGTRLTIRIRRFLPLGIASPTAADYRAAFERVNNSEAKCPLAALPTQQNCECASDTNKVTATCTFQNNAPAVFKYDICVKRPNDPIPGCVDPTGMIN